MKHWDECACGADRLLDRRQLLGEMGSGLSGIALAYLLAGDGAAAAAATTKGAAGAVNPLAPRASHFPQRATRVIQVFCPGAVSHLDTWDYKPELIKHHGEPMPGEKIVTFQGANGSLMMSPWEWAQRGRSGKWTTSLFPHLNEHVDEMAFFHSMTARSNTHGPAMLQMNTGFILEGFPSIGAWTTFALGTVSQDLPAFVAIPDVRGLPPNGPANWNSGFLPAAYQGTAFNAEHGIANLAPPKGSTPERERDIRGFLKQLNEEHLQENPDQTELAARIAAYELAARMQLSAPEVSDLSRESAATLALYGADSQNPLKAAFARNAILARRLLEKGVRFVQLYCGGPASTADGLLNWDAHKTLKKDYDRHSPIMDQPVAALLTDLKQRGLLQDTLVLWCTEFGRMPTHQANTEGRDHNPNAFTVWMAGAGVKGGSAYGATDDFGYKSVQDVATIYDFHATVLQLLGLDHKKLTYYHNGIQRRLTDVHGEVIRAVLS